MTHDSSDCYNSQQIERSGAPIPQENKEKLPNGLGYLVKEAEKRDVKFGIWIDGRRFGPTESGKSYTGDYLMKIGLNVGSSSPLTSSVFEITE